MQYTNSTGPLDNVNVDVNEKLHYGTPLLITNRRGQTSDKHHL